MGKRRSNGEGSAPRQRNDGRWMAEVVVGHRNDGTAIRKYAYGRTEALCSAKLRKIIRDAEDGVLTTGKAPMLEEWLYYWMDQIADLRYNTRKGYESRVRVWISGTKLARRRLDKLTPEDFDALYARMREAGRAETFVLQMHRILSRALKVAVQRRRLGSNPLDRMDSPSPRNLGRVKGRTLTPDQARDLIGQAELRPLSEGTGWMFALANGPRQGERLALGWDMIDLESGKVRIERSLEVHNWKHGCATPERCSATHGWGRLCPERHSGGLFFGEPKSDAGDRTNVLPAPLLERFRLLRAERDDRERLLGEDYPVYTDPAGVEVDLVFCQENGRPIHPRSDYKSWHAFLDAAGVDRMRVHDARHTAATTHLLLGTDPRVVMDMFGWSQASMLDRYQHVLDDLRAEAAANIAAHLWGAAPEPTPPAEGGGEVVSLDAFRRARRA